MHTGRHNACCLPADEEKLFWGRHTAYCLPPEEEKLLRQSLAVLRAACLPNKKNFSRGTLSGEELSRRTWSLTACLQKKKIFSRGTLWVLRATRPTKRCAACLLKKKNFFKRHSDCLERHLLRGVARDAVLRAAS